MKSLHLLQALPASDMSTRGHHTEEALWHRLHAAGTVERRVIRKLCPLLQNTSLGLLQGPDSVGHAMCWVVPLSSSGFGLGLGCVGPLIGSSFGLSP